MRIGDIVGFNPLSISGALSIDEIVYLRTKGVIVQPPAFIAWGKVGSADILGSNSQRTNLNPPFIPAISYANIAPKSVAFANDTSYGVSGLLMDDGTVYTAGSTNYGCNDRSYSYASEWKPGNNKWTSFSNGYMWGAGVKLDGTLWVTGYGSYNRLGLGSTSNVSSFTQNGTDTDWAKVTCGTYNGIAIKTDGTAWFWGQNTKGPFFASGDTTVPTKINDVPYTDAKINSSGGIMLAQDGTIWAFGQQSYGMQGDGSTASTSVAIHQVGTDNDWVKIGLSPYGMAAMKSDGTIWSWGWNDAYTLGHPTQGEYVTTPRQIEGVWKDFVYGRGGALFLKHDGELWACGEWECFDWSGNNIDKPLSPLTKVPPNSTLWASEGNYQLMGVVLKG